jgi:hypothetical protein
MHACMHSWSPGAEVSAHMRCIQVLPSIWARYACWLPSKSDLRVILIPSPTSYQYVTGPRRRSSENNVNHNLWSFCHHYPPLSPWSVYWNHRDRREGDHQTIPAKQKTNIPYIPWYDSLSSIIHHGNCIRSRTRSTTSYCWCGQYWPDQWRDYGYRR